MKNSIPLEHATQNTHISTLAVSIASELWSARETGVQTLATILQKTLIDRLSRLESRLNAMALPDYLKSQLNFNPVKVRQDSIEPGQPKRLVVFDEGNHAGTLLATCECDFEAKMLVEMWNHCVTTLR